MNGGRGRQCHECGHYDLDEVPKVQYEEEGCLQGRQSTHQTSSGSGTHGAQLPLYVDTRLKDQTRAVAMIVAVMPFWPGS